jgi:hypothetical protein
MSIRKFSTASISAGTNKSTKLWDQETFQSGMFALATVSLTSTVSSVTFSDIPPSYTHLQIRGISRASTSGERNNMFYLTYNGDTAANYSWHNLLGSGASVFAEGASSTSIPRTGMSTAATALSGNMGPVIIDILDYTNTNKNKTLRSLTGFDNNGAGEIYFNSTSWRNTSAVTSITLTPFQGNGASSFVANTSFALYGIKAG